MTKSQNYCVIFLVDNTPEETFNAINNPRGWWSQIIEGVTDKLGAEFNYHYRDVHRAKFKITEFVPNKKVVWHVVDNYFDFIKDKNEWIDTDVVFEVAQKGDQTEVRFTHIGLVPGYECYEVCSNAWGTYITSSLRDLITTGKGNPRPIEEIVDKAREMRGQNYTVAFVVNQSPQEIFAAVNNVRGWWTEDMEGDSDKLGAVFKVHFGDVHHSTQQITEWVPGQKVVWHVTDSQLNFLKDKKEWTGTDIVFDIIKRGDKTELRFTHIGLIPAIECYGDCSNAWGYYINGSLRSLITTGQGQPGNPEKIPSPIKLDVTQS